MSQAIRVRRAAPQDKPEWLRMRLALWPGHTAQELQEDMDRMLEDPLQPVFVAERSKGKLGGFLEAGLRKYAEGCATSPVGYLEGWYMDPDLRRTGVGGALVRAAEDWARGQGCQEMGSDTWLDHEVSIQAHQAMGYKESERLVHFRKTL